MKPLGTRPRILAALMSASALAGLLTAASLPAADASQTAATADGRCAPGTATPPTSTTWRQTFGDEFDTTTLDESKWNTYMDFAGARGKYQHNDAYLSYALEKNIVLDGDGTLKLRADKETVVGTDPVGTWDYSEGFIASHDKFYQRYGYWEICARYPAGKGLWPAFWTAAQNRTWPDEFDIAEWFGGGRTEVPSGEPVMFMGHVKGGSWNRQNWYGEFVPGTAPTEGWHTYGLEWRNGYAAYYIDGVKHHEVAGDDKVPVDSMYLILNSGVTGRDNLGGPPDDTTVWPNDFQVDYVRVYQSSAASR
jgi:beta-glucanase (GH16 family)